MKTRANKSGVQPVLPKSVPEPKAEAPESRPRPESDTYGAGPKAGPKLEAKTQHHQASLGRGAAGARILAGQHPAPGLRSAYQQLQPLVKTLWERRDDIAMQPHTGAAWLAISAKGPPERVEFTPRTYVRELVNIARRRPDNAVTSSRLSKNVEALQEQVKNAEEAGQGWARIARDTLHFHRADADPQAAKEQVFLQVPPEFVPQLMAALVPEVIDSRRAFPGVLGCRVASPFWPAPGNVVLSTQGGEDTERVLSWLAKLHQAQPTWFGQETPPLSEPRRPGIAVGQVPPRDRYPDETFESLRAQVLHSVACEGSERQLGAEAFSALFDARWREAGLDPMAPHRNLQAVQAMDKAVIPLPGAVPVTAGILKVEVPGFEAPQMHAVELQISPEVAATLGRRKDVRFLPKQGQFVRVDIDRTRNPPRERIVRQFSAAFVDDTRYRLDFGTLPPPYVHFDRATQSYHIPTKVTFAPPPKGRYGNYVLQVQTSPERASLDKPQPALLIDKLNDVEVQGEKLAKVMQRIEGYVADPDAQRTQRVTLEEGTNGVSVVSLSNRAAGVWKPTAAEYPEQARVHLEPDHQARREAFAYFISKNLGHLGRVPPTVYREIDGDSGAYCALSRGTLPGTHCARLEQILADPQDPAYRDMAVFDCVIGNLDRHSGNILLGGGTVLAIDHGLAFPLEHGAQGEMNFLFSEPVALSAEHRQNIAALLERAPELRAEAQRLQMHPDAVNRMLERMQRMLQLGRTYDGWRSAEAP